MSKSKSIGAKVSVMLPTIDSWDKIGSDQTVIILPLDNMKWNKSKSVNDYMSGYPGVKWERVIIQNSGFTISILPSYDDPYCQGYPKAYIHTVLVKLSHPELDRYPFQIGTYINSRTLINILSKSQNMIDRTLSGNFCCIHESGFSGIYYTIFDVEDPENLGMASKKELGKIISERRGTTKWKPGYSYVTKTEKSFIYLGDISDGWWKLRYSSDFGYQLPATFYNIMEKTTETTSLIMYTSDLTKDMADLIESNRGGYISTILTSCLEYTIKNKTSYYAQSIRTINRSSHSAIEMEQVFEDDKKNLKELITQFFTSRYPSCSDYPILIDREKLNEAGRDILDSLMIKIVKIFVEQKRYDRVLVLAKDPDKFTEYLKSSKSTYRYFGNEIFGVLEYLGEEEFKKIVKRCSF